MEIKNKNTVNHTIVYRDLTYKINGVLFFVHNELGRFCTEKQYGDAIEQKFKDLNIKYKRELILPPSFCGEVRGRNKVDFLIEDKVILEIKAKSFIGREEYYQVRRYLDAIGKKLGLLINFRNKNLIIKRILNSNANE